MTKASEDQAHKTAARVEESEGMQVDDKEEKTAEKTESA